MPKNRAKAEYEKDVLGEVTVEIEPSELTVREIKSILDSAFTGSSFRVNLSAGDIEIGAVEIKDRDTDERARVVNGRVLVSSNVENFPDTYPLPEYQFGELAKEATLSDIRGKVENLSFDNEKRLKVVLPYDARDRSWTLDSSTDSVSVSGSVSVSNFPSDYPLPLTQVTDLKNKVRIMAWNGSTYELIEGYEGQKTLSYDADGNLTQVTLTVVKDDGTEVQVRRTYTYDANGNLTQVSRWEVV